jgi:chemotaxis protein CheX
MTDPKFLNPFIDAANEVLMAETDISVKRGDITHLKSSFTSSEVSILLCLVGQVQGVVIWGVSMDVCLALVSSMMGQTFSEFNNLAQSGIAELGNVITGRATIKLSQAGFASKVSPPTVIQGNGVKISTLDFARTAVPLHTNIGEITLHLALRENKTGSEEDDFLPFTFDTN